LAASLADATVSHDAVAVVRMFLQHACHNRDYALLISELDQTGALGHLNRISGRASLA
jgi:hypothetical protein